MVPLIQEYKWTRIQTSLKTHFTAVSQMFELRLDWCLKPSDTQRTGRRFTEEHWRAVHPVREKQWTICPSIIYPSSIHHPFINHPSSIHHPSTIIHPSIHPSFILEVIGSCSFSQVVLGQYPGSGPGWSQSRRHFNVQLNWWQHWAKKIFIIAYKIK